MMSNIIHEEKFTHGTEVISLYIISFDSNQNKEEFQNLIKEKQIQTIFILEDQEKILNFQNINKSLVGKDQKEQFDILFNEIYLTKKNLGLILSKTNNKSLYFFASYMILREQKNNTWLYQQNFYRTLLEQEKIQLINLIKYNPSKQNQMFLETLKIDYPNLETFSSYVINAERPGEQDQNNLNPPDDNSEQDPIFPKISIDSVIIQDSSQNNQSTQIQQIEQSNSHNSNPQFHLNPEQEQIILELAPSIKFKSLYQKYTIKCFK
ncbi:unnamed protein product [Paramecium primaurelia]|uniref:Uncharacterized protein n=1 Tax=Paramecium primaurelia TaxID=5886 RepID=A0A8S1M969_PARPR|nr:unnamed protein product [Paramecium primaurelia]